MALTLAVWGASVTTCLISLCHLKDATQGGKSKVSCVAVVVFCLFAACDIQTDPFLHLSFSLLGGVAAE